MLDDIRFQYFSANIYDPIPLGFVGLKYFLNSTKNPSPSIKEVFKKIQEAELAGDMKLKATLKQDNLFYVTPCCIFDGSRCYSNIVSFNGLLVLDFDHIDNADDFKQFLFSSCDFVIASWKSPSGRGVKTLVKIPVVSSVEEFKEYFFGLAYYMSKYNGFDATGQNISLPLFISWDENILIRDNPTTWTQKGKKINEFDYSNEIEVTFEGERTEYEKNIVKKKIRTMIENIEDNAHPVVRSSAILCGGYCAFGYLDLEEARDFIYNLIDENSYTSQKASTYKKTADKFLVDGMKRPLELNM